MKLICTKETKGFTLGKEYNLLGCAGEYVELIDDNNEKVILFEGYFNIVENK